MVVARRDAFDRLAGQVVRERLGLETRLCLGESQIDTASTLRPCHSRGTAPRTRNQLVDHGAPTAAPR